MLKRILVAVATLAVLSGPVAAQGTTCVYTDWPPVEGNEGAVAFAAGDFETAIEAWTPCAEAGDALGQYMIATAYLNLGDIARAIGWLEEAIATGRRLTPPPTWLQGAVDLLAGLR